MKQLKTNTHKISILAVCGVLALLCLYPSHDGYARKSASKATTQTSSKSGKGKSKTTAKGKGSKTGKKTQTKTETSADVKKKEADTRREIKQTEQQIRENEAAVKKSLGELGRLQEDIEVSQKKVADAGTKVTALGNRISQLETQIGVEQKSLDKLRSEYLKAVKAMRAKRKGQSALAFVFSASSFNEGLRRMRYMKQFRDWRDKQTNQISAKIAKLKTQSEELARTKSMHDRELAAETRARDRLRTQYDQKDALIVDLKKNGDALRSHLAKKQQEANALRGRVASLIAEETRKAQAAEQARLKAEADKQAKAIAKAEEERKAREEADRKAALAQNKPAASEMKKESPASTVPAKKEPKKEKEKSPKVKEKKQEARNDGDVSYAEARKRKSKKEKGTPAPTPTPSPSVPKPVSPEKAYDTPKAAASGNSFESMRGALPRPVAGSFRVTSRFGKQCLPDMPDVCFDNPGIDAEVAPGSSAQAVFAGKVSGVYMVPGYATVIIVKHDNYYTVYGNIASPGVKVGDTVKSGQALGKLSAAEDDPSHSMIHFEVWKNRDKLDPLSWIR